MTGIESQRGEKGIERWTSERGRDSRETNIQGETNREEGETEREKRGWRGRRKMAARGKRTRLRKCRDTGAGEDSGSKEECF